MKLAALAVVLLFAGCNSGGADPTVGVPGGFDGDLLWVWIGNASGRYVFVSWDGAGVPSPPQEPLNPHEAILPGYFPEGVHSIRWSYDLETWETQVEVVAGESGDLREIWIGHPWAVEPPEPSEEVAMSLHVSAQCYEPLRIEFRPSGTETWYLMRPGLFFYEDYEIRPVRAGAYQVRAGRLESGSWTFSHWVETRAPVGLMASVIFAWPWCEPEL